jgi:hypothetical protein
LASGGEGQAVAPGASLGHEEVAGPDLAGVHGDAGYVYVRPVQRLGEGAGQVGEKDEGLETGTEKV